MSYLLFQISIVVYFAAMSMYVVFFISQKSNVRQIARKIFVVAALLHTLNIVTRYFEAGHTPITSQHETVSFFAWSIAWCYLSFRWRYTVKNFGTFVSVLTVILMFIAALASREILPLVPALQSWWLPFHASVSIIADGFLALACIGGIMYLLQERAIKRKQFGLFFSRLPSLESLDQLNHHCLSVGFPLLTLGIISGSIWAKQAWGAYWHWDPKETWSLITWFLYAALVHQRFTVGWRGRPAAIMTIVAFLAVLFTLWGVTYLLVGFILMPRDSIVLLGVNHKTTPLEIREKLALSGGYEEPLRKLGAVAGIKEHYLLSTCNRVEVLYTAEHLAETRERVLHFLFGVAVPVEDLEKYVYYYENEDAVQHLFMVSSSLDSMIVGEAQILGQLKEAYRFATEQKTSGLILNKLLHKAFFAAKRVRTETQIGASAVSISYAAVELARKIFGQLDNKSVMLVGAGEMAELAAEHLVGQGVTNVVVANRTLERAVKLARRFNGRAVSLDELIEQLEYVDIIISSTGATGTILSKEDVKPVMRERRNRPLFFIDIAVPRDLDQDINDLDNVYLYDIDDLNNVVEMNRAGRDREAVKAERIVAEETMKFSHWLDNMELNPTIVELRKMADDISRGELEKTLGKMKDISPKEQKSLEKMAAAIVAKMLHNPIQFLKSDNSRCTDRRERITTIRDLFQLNDRNGSSEE